MPQEIGEFDWSGEKEKRHEREVRRTEITGVIMLVIFVTLIGGSFIPFHQLFLSDEEMKKLYTPTFEWLNRCDDTCQANTNPRFLHGITDCDTLTKQYEEHRTNYNIEWRIAVDDRASFVGCPGFPKEMTKITQDGDAAVEAIQERQEVARQEKVQIEKDMLSDQMPRYRQSLIEGNVRRFTLKFQQDTVDPETMVVVVSDMWLRQNEYLRRQIAEVLWQKWANIRSPLDPEKVRLMLVDASGKRVGGSPETTALPIWVASGSLLPAARQRTGSGG